MKLTKFIVRSFLILFIFIIACILYGFKVEPYMLKTVEYKLNDISIEDMKIVHISDIHIKKDYDEGRLLKIVDDINKQNPDIVVFTGDLFDDFKTYGDINLTVSYLEKIESKYGKFAIWGNHDYGGGGKRAYEEIMHRSGFEILKNSYEVLNIDGSNILIYGLDDYIFGGPEYICEVRDYDYSIILSHEQQFIMENNIDADLILTGHTHGGQINIPLLNEMDILKKINPTLTKNYIKGIYRTQNGTLFVNSGIGTTVLSARFNVKPEISVINISKP